MARNCASFADLNRDPAVTAHFPQLLSEEQSNQLVDRIEAHFEQHSFGLWAGREVRIAWLRRTRFSWDDFSIRRFLMFTGYDATCSTGSARGVAYTEDCALGS